MSNTRLLPTLLGHQIKVFNNDHVGDKIATQGLYEKENLLLLLALLKQIPAPVVLDIGANIGNHSLAFATVASQVHAFEPLPHIFNLLQDNISNNHLDNVVAHQLALSDQPGEDTLYMVLQGNFGASSFDKRTEGVEAVTVNKVVGDEFLSKLKLPKIDLIKIDVEAHEVFVLRGLRHTLETWQPFITMEWNDPLTIERLQGSPELDFLQTHYQILVLGSNYDRGYWQGQFGAFVRRKLTRLCQPRTAVLYPFHPDQLYKNLLLIPRGKEAMVRQLGLHW